MAINGFHGSDNFSFSVSTKKLQNEKIKSMRKVRNKRNLNK